MKKAILLLSGGLDSTTVGALAKSQGYELTALTILYGQRHHHELTAAKRVAAFLGITNHFIVPLDIGQFGGNCALTDETVPVPKHTPPAEIGRRVPVTYVPARNTVFLSLALSCAEAIGARDIFIGISEADSSGYPDCRRVFVEKFTELAAVATATGDGHGPFIIHAPLLTRTKAETIRLGLSLGVDYSITHTCYDPAADGTACGSCEACLLRQRGWEEIVQRPVFDD